MSAVPLAIGSVVVAIVVLGLKTLAWRVTGSTALYADALESVVNLAASGAALWALLVARRPADANHPFGHHKAEYLSAVLEGVLIVLAALSILWEAWHGFQAMRVPEDTLAGIAINALATTLNLGWALLLLRRGRSLRSPALLADGRHLLADVVTSTGVIAGLAIIPSTGWLWLDPLLATLTALHILGSGTYLVRTSVSGLMDEAVEPETLARIKAIVSGEAIGAIEAHDMRTRQAGRSTFVDFHLVVPGSMTVIEAHDICDRIEAGLKREIDDLSVTIHVEPEPKAKSQGIRVLSLLAAALAMTALLVAPHGRVAFAQPAAAPPVRAVSEALEPPQRIVSINLCADQIVLLLAPRERIQGLTPLATDRVLSSYAERADGLPRVRAEAEAVLARKPDLVLAGQWGSALTRRAIEARGVRLVELPTPHDLDGIEHLLRVGGAVFGRAREAEAEIAAFRAERSALARAAPTDRPRALLWQARGFAAGHGTFGGALLHEAGFANAVPFAGYGYVPLESVLAQPPALLLMTGQGANASLAALLLRHPAIERRAIERRSIDPAALTCATPRSMVAARAMRG